MNNVYNPSVDFCGGCKHQTQDALGCVWYTGQDRTKICGPTFGTTLYWNRTGLSGTKMHFFVPTRQMKQKQGKSDKICKLLDYTCQIKTLKPTTIFSSIYSLSPIHASPVPSIYQTHPKYRLIMYNHLNFKFTSNYCVRIIS